MFTKQTKQSQTHPGGSQPSPFPWPLAPFLNPGWPGGLGFCSLARDGGVAGPQVSGNAHKAMSAISSPSSSSPPRKIPAKKAYPSPQLQHRDRGSLGKGGQLQTPQHRGSPEPRWKRTCESGQVQQAKQPGRSLHSQRRRPPWGSAALARLGLPRSPTIINPG